MWVALACAAALLALAGLVMVVSGWRHPGGDVGVIIRGVLIYGGLAALGAAAIPLGLMLALRRAGAGGAAGR